MQVLQSIENEGLDTYEKVRDFFTSHNIKCKDGKSDWASNLYLLMYDMIKTDFKQPFSRNCRGIILEKGTNCVVCYPFDKFFNYGEKHADMIDWESARYVEKLDGSIIKLFYYGEQWRIATNSCVDADTARTRKDNRSFRELFLTVPNFRIFPRVF